jgi:PleD family two-component response regulator
LIHEESILREFTALEPSPVVLIVDNDVLKLLALASDLRVRGLQAFEAADATEAMVVLEKIVADVVLSDASLLRAAELAQWVREHQLPTQFIWTTGQTFRQPLRQLRS